MIYLRLAHAAHVGGELPDLLLINALNNNFILRGNFYGDIGVLLYLHRMGIAHAEHQLLALLGGAVAHALNFQRFFIAAGYARNHVVYKGAAEPVQRALKLSVSLALYKKLSVLLLNLYFLAYALGKSALGPLNGYVVEIGRASCRERV